MGSSSESSSSSGSSSSSSGSGSQSSGSHSSGSSPSRSKSPRAAPREGAEEPKANGGRQPSPAPKAPKEQGTDGGVTRLVVGNLTRNVTEDHIREIFGCYGTLKSIDLAIDRAVNLPRGFAHIEFEAREDAEKALDFMNNGQIDGNIVKVNFILLPKKRSPGPQTFPPRTCVAVCCMQ
ncbi:Arginine/serine-rich protein 45 [Tetrabaena socialis]|uniref:Arginine/serine-rich protein 45 n=1 Tax=Tetrabaena socialis TaxID=47790 RepID=A0A2J8A909_9CHLO|nr:Arginine/serine-rich protein 45 [Tetrabaena socialis]|eukprot:PNH08985.1 Arginine/serine-rich protein 45 [Tetrabaena socialis]